MVGINLNIQYVKHTYPGRSDLRLISYLNEIVTMLHCCVVVTPADITLVQFESVWQLSVGAGIYFMPKALPHLLGRECLLLTVCPMISVK